MKIVLASRWFPVGVGAYLLLAARRISGLEVTVVGPTTGAQCWTKDFQYPEHAVTPDFLDLHDFKSRAHADQAPDLWIDVDGGWFTDEPMPWPHAIVATDPHIADQGEHWTYERQRLACNFFFNMQRPYCQNGSDEELRRPDFHLPYAYDSAVFRPMPLCPEDAHVSVLGVPYPKRTEVAHELQRRGFRVLAGMGDVYEAYAKALNRAPVCFIWSLKDDVPCRVFEAAACGRAIVVNASIADEIHRILPALKVRAFHDALTDLESVQAAADEVECCFEKRRGPDARRWFARASTRLSGAENLAAVQGETWEKRLRTIVRVCLGREP